MTPSFDIRLIGGPFDGDQGVVGSLPSVLFAWPCHGATCRICNLPDTRPGEIHWTVTAPSEYEAARRLGGTPYRRDALTEEGWWRFIYADGLAAPLGQTELQHLLQPTMRAA